MQSKLKARLVRLVGLLRRPGRLLAYVMLKLAYRLKWERIPVLPTRIDVEPINTCNFRCDHCQVTHWEKSKAQLDLVTFRKILNEFPHLEEIKLQGMGEPLLNKDFVKLLKEGEGDGITMHFHSNGSAVTPAIAQNLLELRDTSIVFSIDGATAETFQKIRPGSNFARIRTNLQRLTELRGKKRSPKIQAWTVITRDNIHEIPDIVQLCADLGLDRVTLQPFLTEWGKDEMQEHVISLRVDSLQESYATLLHESHQVASKAGIVLDIVSNSMFSPAKKCTWPWERTYIAANGDVVPCCVIADADVIKMGNVFEQPFSEIWNGPKYRELRNDLKNDNVPSFCKACYEPEDASA